jgi:hypothetical protein
VAGTSRPFRRLSAPNFSFPNIRLSNAPLSSNAKNCGSRVNKKPCDFAFESFDGHVQPLLRAPFSSFPAIQSTRRLCALDNAAHVL